VESISSCFCPGRWALEKVAAVAMGLDLAAAESEIAGKKSENITKHEK